MNVAILSSIAWRTPPIHYGPWELVASLICEELVRQGHSVTLFATGNSQTAAKLEAVCPRGYEEDEVIKENVDNWQSLHLSHFLEHADTFDVIHNHSNFQPILHTDSINSPMITTMHCGTIEFSSKETLDIFKKYNDSNYYVALSNAAKHQDLEYTATIHHGIDVNKFSLGTGEGGYLLSFGRIHPDKGTADAISIAKQTNHRLIIAGIVHDQRYFDERVRPHLDDDLITFVGSVGGQQKNELLKNAKALVSPIYFEEPFGLSVLEAMACGTPVIVYNRGAASEVVDHEKTGFVVSGIEQAVEAVSQLANIDRNRCRRHVATHFSLDKMIASYLEVYDYAVGDFKQRSSL